MQLLQLEVVVSHKIWSEEYLDTLLLYSLKITCFKASTFFYSN